VQTIDAATVAKRLQPATLVAALERMFRQGCTAPVREHHTIPVPGSQDGSLLLMPAWQAGGYLGIKLVSVFPGNSRRHLPAVSAAYVLADAGTGAIHAMIDGGELTARRTAATSALAARYLARADAASLLIVGTGRIARHLAQFHAALRPGLKIEVWGRTPAHATALAGELCDLGIATRVASDLAAAAVGADIISTATLAAEPLIHGAWIRPGTHVDLVGGYTPGMREADDSLIAKARVCVDTREGAMQEAGDILSPIASGVLKPESVCDLADLTRGLEPGRRDEREITVFKSVGAASEDLAAAILVFENP
jgi:ornithine cyclodeaminase